MSVWSVVVAQLQEKRLHELGYTGLVRCQCGHEERVRIFACLRLGWPKHCGETMQLVKNDEEGT